MSDEVGLPEVDDVLPAAFEAQGEAGVRALGLLRDARRVLTGAGFVRLEEVAAARVRSAADALPGLPGAPVTAGLKPAVDAYQPPTAVEDFPPGHPSAKAGTPDPANSSSNSGAAQGPSAAVHARWERVSAAAGVLRGELECPGGFHRARARGIVERLLGIPHGSAAGPGAGLQGVSVEHRHLSVSGTGFLAS
ncbi:hypothetical protein AB0D27_25535 [Streptomyces sp. NPDC048415]|uniref:hypothetical protein n=1 Tax=Streptomyces sp. NPDC048415 TaxID=3154822 RepID=UPI00341E659C